MVEAAGLQSEVLNGVRGRLNGNELTKQRMEGRLGVTFPSPHGNHEVGVENLCPIGGGGEDCAICTAPLLSLGQLIVTTGCRHRFHTGCLVEWAHREVTEVRRDEPPCPLCRAAPAKKPRGQLVHASASVA